MRRPPHRGQNPRPLHENATRRSSPQAVHRKRAKPPARHPHRRKSRNSRSTNRGIPSPSRSGAARARRVSKCSCTIPYKMVDVGSRASYALEGCATRRPQAPRVPITRDRSIRRGSCDQVQRGRAADNRGCHRVQIESTAGAITGRLFGVNARTSRTTRRATTVTVLSPTAVARKGWETSHLAARSTSGLARRWRRSTWRAKTG